MWYFFYLIYLNTSIQALFKQVKKNENMNLFNPPSVNYSSLKQGNRAYTTVKYNRFPANSYTIILVE
jgi:hypothetical protein